jgi:hypothetical protein
MNPTLRAARVIALSLVPIAMLSLAAPVIHVRVLAGLAIGFAVACIALVAGTLLVTRAFDRAREAYTLAITGLLLVGASYWVAHLAHGRAWIEIASALFANAGVLAVASALGVAVGLNIADPGHLLAVACASSAADIWSVSSPRGLTHAVITSPDVALQRMVTLSAAIPPDRIPQPQIGFGDVIFAAVYFAASTKHGLSRTRTALAVAIGLLLAGVATFVLRQPMPALTFIGAAVVAAHRRAWRIPARDRLATALAVAAVVIVGVAATRR